MNDYLTKSRNDAAALRGLMLAVAAALPEKWGVEDIKEHDGFPAPWLHMIAPDGFTVQAQWAVERERVEFSAVIREPYTDEGGQTKHIFAVDLDRDTQAPTTTAAADRPAKAIANQLQSRVIEPGREIRKRARDQAHAYGSRAAKTAAARDELLEAAGCKLSEFAKRSGGNVTVYAANVPGQPRVEFRSPRSVIMEVTAAEAVHVLNLLRDLRAGEEVAA